MSVTTAIWSSIEGDLKNEAKVPLSAFGGINLANIRSVQFTFDEQVQGGVLITDVAFASAPR